MRGPWGAISDLPGRVPWLSEARWLPCTRHVLREKDTFPYLDSPTRAAAEPTLPVYERRPSRLRSTLTGTFVSKGPISISPLWFPYLLAGLGFSPSVSRRGPPKETRPGGPGGGGTTGRRREGSQAAELLARPRGTVFCPPPWKASALFRGKALLDRGAQ